MVEGVVAVFFVILIIGICLSYNSGQRLATNLIVVGLVGVFVTGAYNVRNVEKQ